MENRGQSDIVSATIAEFCRITGLGRSKVYQLLSSGLIDSIYIGKRRLILLDSYRKLIEQQRGSKTIAQPKRSQPAPRRKIARRRFALID